MMPPERVSNRQIAKTILSTLGFLFNAVAALVLGVIGLAIMVSGETTGQSGSLLWSLGWSSLLSALLIFPAAIQGWFRLLHRNPPVWQAKHPFLIASLGLLLWPLFLWLANHISGQSAAGLALPLVRIMIILLPIWWFFEIGRWKITASSSERNWAVAGISLTITPLIIISLETVVLILAVGFVLSMLSSVPGFADQMAWLSGRLLSGLDNPELALQIIAPYFAQPVILLTSLGLFSGLVPLLEELLKPLVLWTWIKRRLTPAEGFVIGLICGGIFALMESLMAASAGSGEFLRDLAVARVGTGLLHMATSGLVGATMAYAWQNGKYLRLAIAYAISVFWHGLWNFFAVLTGFGSLLPGMIQSEFLNRLNTITPAALVIMLIISLALMIGANRIVRRDSQPAPVIGIPRTVLVSSETDAVPPVVE